MQVSLPLYGSPRGLGTLQPTFQGPRFQALGLHLDVGRLRMIRMITREDKAPGLGDVPVPEWLFKNHRCQRQASDLYFFVTPRLIR